jgi:hypothetical protein
VRNTIGVRVAVVIVLLSFVIGRDGGRQQRPTGAVDLR